MSKGIAQGFSDGMRGIALHMRRQMQQLILIQLIRMNGTDLKTALRQRAGLVKDHRLYFRQCFQIIRAFDQHALTAGPADTGKET